MNDDLRLILSLAHRQRLDVAEDLPLKIRQVDGTFKDVSRVEGQGTFYLRVKDAGCDVKEAIRMAAAITLVDEEGRRQVYPRPFRALALMLHEGLLVGCRLPLKATDDEGNDQLRAFYMDATKGDLESHAKNLDANIDPAMAAVLFHMLDEYYGLTGGTKIEEVAEQAKNLPEPPASTEETS